MSCLARCLCVLAFPFAASMPLHAAHIDSFDDGVMGSEWALIEDSPAQMWLLEANGRLELHAAGPVSPATDALYISDGANGFQLSTAADFAISLDYDFSGFSGAGTIALDLGIGRDLDGTDSAAVGYSRSTNPLLNGALGAAFRVADVQTAIPLALGAATSGTFAITYASALDRLTLGAAAGSVDLDNLVVGTWGASSVYVSFGGRGDGLTLGTGDAWLDNLSITGEFASAQQIPEPATLSLLAIGAAAAVRRRRKSTHARTQR